MGFKSSAREDATFHSTFISHTQIGGKLENILNKLPKKCTVHVLHQIYVCTSDHWRRLQHIFRCFRTKTRHAAGRMKPFRKGHVMCRILSIKWDCFLICFVQNIRYIVGTSDVTTISNDLYCFTILGSTSIVIVYTAWSNTYSEIGPEVTLQPLMTSCAKDYKGHSLMQTSFTEPPSTMLDGCAGLFIL